MNAKTALTSVPVHPLLAERWSPRGFDARHELTERQLQALLEAARWSPSANNTQPWRFLVGRRGDATFAWLLEQLAPGNRAWAHAAGALVLVVAETVDEKGRPRPWALFDAGQTVAALSVQAQADGLAVHPMGGFDAEAVGTALGMSLTPVVVVAVGRRDPDAVLAEPFASREAAPRTRLPLEELLLPATVVKQHAA